MNELLGTTAFEIGMSLLLALMGISLALCFVRLYLGPNPPNRAVAFDLISVHAVGIFALFAVRANAIVLVDGTIVTTVLGFLGTLMLARYLESANMDDWEVEMRPGTEFSLSRLGVSGEGERDQGVSTNAQNEGDAPASAAPSSRTALSTEAQS